MSRSIKGTKGPGYDYWSKRSWSGSKWLPFPGSDTKKLTSRRDRRANKKVNPEQ